MKTASVFLVVCILLGSGCEQKPANQAPTATPGVGTDEKKMKPEKEITDMEAQDFASRAPKGTRLLLKIKPGLSLHAIQTAWLNQTFMAQLKACGLDLAQDLPRFMLAWADRENWRMQLHGRIKIKDLACLFDKELEEDGWFRLDEIEFRQEKEDSILVAKGSGLQFMRRKPGQTENRFAVGLADSRVVAVGHFEAGGFHVSYRYRTGPDSSDLLLRLVDAKQGASFAGKLDPENLEFRRNGREIEVRGGSLSLAMWMREYLVEGFDFPSASMFPTLEPGDKVLVVKGPFLGRVERGDLVVFPSPDDPDHRYLKRVIGMGGETVRGQACQLLIDGKKVGLARKGKRKFVDVDPEGQPVFSEGQLFEERIGEQAHSILAEGACLDFDPVEIPAGHLFVMGDNRNNSRDSRHFGTISLASIVGRAEVIYWSSTAEEIRAQRIGLPLD